MRRHAFTLLVMMLLTATTLLNGVRAQDYSQNSLDASGIPPSTQPLRISPGAPLQGGIEQSAMQGNEQSAMQGNVQSAMQGSVQSAMQGNMQSAMQGNVQGGQLNGGLNGWGGQLMPGQGMTQQPNMNGNQQAIQSQVSGNGPLLGGASADPDAGSQELTIDWDRWRNALMRAIEEGVLQKINVHNDVHFVWDPRTQMMQSRYPNGTSAWYGLQVLPDRKIVNIAITQSSRFPSFDQAVFEAINDLQGKRLLEYPKGSKRTIVTQQGNVSTSPQTSFPTFNFQDIERQRN